MDDGSDEMNRSNYIGINLVNQSNTFFYVAPMVSHGWAKAKAVEHIMKS